VTPEISFECLLISHDPAVFCTMHQILQDFSISTNICLSTSNAADLLEERNTDLIVIDWDAPSSAHFVQEILNSQRKQKPTILALAADDRAIPGVHFVAQKPVTRESVTNFMRSAYSSMVKDFRKHVRYALMAEVHATDTRKRKVSLTIRDIGEGGIGISTIEKLSVGDVLSFALLLPGSAKAVLMEARVQWTKESGIAGCQFGAIPSNDSRILQEWLKDRCRIRRPRAAWRE
jgi:hypothetical protein